MDEEGGQDTGGVRERERERERESNWKLAYAAVSAATCPAPHSHRTAPSWATAFLAASKSACLPGPRARSNRAALLSCWRRENAETLGRVQTCTHERERTHTSALALACAFASLVRTMMDECYCMLAAE